MLRIKICTYVKHLNNGPQKRE